MTQDTSVSLLGQHVLMPEASSAGQKLVSLPVENVSGETFSKGGLIISQESEGFCYVGKFDPELGGSQVHDMSCLVLDGQDSYWTPGAIIFCYNGKMVNIFEC